MNFKIPNRNILLGGIFFILDRLFKGLALVYPNKIFLLNRYFGWEPFFNKGVAFGIALPKFLVITLTVFIVGAVWYFFNLNKRAPANGQENLVALGTIMIMIGAGSNLVDRLVFDFTVDYLRIFNGVINLADLYILFGFICYFSGLKKDA